MDSFSVGTNFLGQTTRPTDGRVVSTVGDTFMVDCTSPTTEDGSELSAEFYNEIIANLRALARGNGNLLTGGPLVPDDLSDGKLITSVLNLIQRGKMISALDTGSANLLSFSLTPAPLELISGMSFVVKKIATKNSAAMQVAINNGTPMPLIWGDGSAMAQGDFPASCWGKITLDATNPTSPFCTYESMPGPGVFARVNGAPIWHLGAASGGTATALTTVLSPAPAALTEGLCIRLPITTTNGASPTLSFLLADGVTTVTKPIVMNGTGVALAGGEMVGGIEYEADLIYDAVLQQFRLLVPAQGSHAAAAFVVFDGTTSPPTIKASFNVISVVTTAAGKNTITYINPMATANYAVVITGAAWVNGGTPTAYFGNLDHETSSTPCLTTSVSILESFDGGNGSTPYTTVMIFQ